MKLWLKCLFFFPCVLTTTTIVDSFVVESRNEYKTNNLNCHNNKTTNTFKVSDIAQYGNDDYFSIKFDEIFIAPTNNQSDQIFSLKKSNNNLLFTVHKNNDQLNSSRLSSNKQVNNNSINGKDYLNKNQILITEISSSLESDGNFSFALNNLVDSSNNTFLNYVMSGNEGYFQLSNPSTTTINIPLTKQKNVHLRFLIDNKSISQMDYSIFFKSGSKTISISSSNTQKKEVNYYSNDNFCGLDGFIGLNSNNELIWTFSTDKSGQQTSLLTINVNENNLTEYKDLKASEAINAIPIGKPTTSGKKTWGDILSFGFRAFNYLQYLNIPITLESADATGTINVNFYSPYSCKNIDVLSDDSFFVATNIKKDTPYSKTISGFSCGTQLLTREINGYSINKIPQIAISNNKNDLYKLVFEQAIGNDNALDTFNYLTDMEFRIVQFNNINGEINCELILKNNYINSSGQQVTNNQSSSFGNIKFINLSKIKPTTNATNNKIMIPTNSSLKNYYPYEIDNYFNDLKTVVFQNINSVVDNIPNSTNASRDFLITDLVIKKEDITPLNSNSITISTMNLKYYFNNTNGSFDNNQDLQINNIIISGFKETNQTVIKNNFSTGYPDVSNVFPNDFLQNGNNSDKLKVWARNFLNSNTNSRDNIIKNVPNDFSINNIIIKNLIPNNMNGSINVEFTINYWINSQGGVVHDEFAIQNLIITGFRQASETKLLTSSFELSNQANSSIVNYSTNLAKNDLISFQSNNKLLSPVPTSFNATDDLVIIENSWTPDVGNGSVSFQIKARNIFDKSGNIISNFKEFGWIKFFGFKKICRTQIKSPNTHDFSTTHANVNVNNITNNEIKNLLVQLFNQNKLLTSWGDGFSPENDIQLSNNNNDYVIRYPNEGKIEVKVYARNVYDGNLSLVNNYIHVGNVILTGFKKIVSTSINSSKEYSMKSLPSIYNNIYATDLSKNPDSGIYYVNNILKLFWQYENIFINLPTNFNFDNDLIVNDIKPVAEGLSAIVDISLTNILIDGEISNSTINGTVVLVEFKQLPITTINSTSFDYNQSHDLSIPCNSAQKTLTVHDVYSQIKQFGNQIILNGNSSSLIKKGLITIENSPINNPLEINVDNSFVSVNEQKNELIIENVLISGSFYYNNSIPIEITNPSSPYVIRIHGFGFIDESYNPLIVSIIIIFSVIGGSIVLAVLLVKLHKKLQKNRKKLDKFDDVK